MYDVYRSRGIAFGFSLLLVVGLVLVGRKYGAKGVEIFASVLAGAITLLIFYWLIKIIAAIWKK